MTIRRTMAGALTACSLAAATPAAAAPWPFSPGAAAVAPAVGEPGLLCRAAIQQAEAGSLLPPHLLAGIARVESGRADPSTGHFHPWPWTINAEGRGSFFDTKEAAIAYVRQLQARGVASYDVGCMQINLLNHPNAFRDLAEAFDPLANARYAVKFLTQLREQTGSWEAASAWYHSADPARGEPYRAMVATAMVTEGKMPALDLPGTVSQPAGLGVVAALRSMPGRVGKIILLAGSPAAVLATPRAAPAEGGGGIATAGRGLDAYRLRPVAVIGMRVLAQR